MKVTLVEAARLLGKSPRQLRYMLKQGELKGEKVEGRWVFDDAALPRSPAQERARAQKAAELEAAVNEGIEAVVRKPRGRGYSVGDLVAFRTGAAACREAARRFGDEHRASVAMRASVVALGQGCHRFHHREKNEAFARAREESAAAVALLHIEGGDAARTLADEIEANYLSALVGLLRPSRRKRS